MAVTGITASSLAMGNVTSSVSKSSDVLKMAKSFGDVLENAMQSADNQEKQVKMLNNQFVTGQLSDVHTLMIASEKAQLGLQLTVQVRNKVIEAYQEIMRTQL
jgi:flagellar hook-basal body complex protein FliE